MKFLYHVKQLIKISIPNELKDLIQSDLTGLNNVFLVYQTKMLIIKFNIAQSTFQCFNSFRRGEFTTFAFILYSVHA